MADISTSENRVEIAQAKKEPKFPKRPEGAQPDAELVKALQLKQWAEELLDCEPKIAAAQKEVRSLFFWGGSKTEASLAIGKLVKLGRAASDLADRLKDDDMCPGAALYGFDARVLGASVGIYKFQEGTAFSLNPFNSEARVRSGQLGAIKNYLNEAQQLLQEAKPYLMQVAGRSAPDPQRKKEPRSDSGPVAA